VSPIRIAFSSVMDIRYFWTSLSRLLEVDVRRGDEGSFLMVAPSGISTRAFFASLTAGDSSSERALFLGAVYCVFGDILNKLEEENMSFCIPDEKG